MRPIDDMIGQFFSNRKGASGAHQAPSPPALDSVTEEGHTRQLLYPETPALSTPAPQATDGPLPEIDLEFPRDCRIIIAQDETPAMPKTILFDSKPALARAESPTQSARARASNATAAPTFGGLHARRSSLVAEPSPRSPTVGGFTRIRSRGGSVSSMPNIDEHAQVQAKAQARAKESTDLANICLDCMFGNLAMNYRGNSNKIHIVPLDAKPAEPLPLSTSIQDATSSLGRAEGLRRRSNLAQSYTPSNPPADRARSGSSDSVPREQKRRTIFITRLFSVTLPEDDQDSRTPTPQSSLPKGNGFPFPPTAQKPGSAAHLSTSTPGPDSLGSSLDSDRRAGWAFVEPNLGVESLLSSSLSSDVDDRVDVVGQHWDVIMRALTSLQYVVQERILAHFKSPEAAALPIVHQHRHQPSRSSLREVSGNPARRPLRLQPNALMLDKDIQTAAELTGGRVVTGMRIPRVMTGQGKWGVWREEARWLGRWAGRKEQNFFFFNLLTAFLGCHTEWLNVLGPKWHRKRHREQQKATAGENLTIPNRTVIVSPDKMAARRLIFLLAAFLPPSAPAVEATSYMRPSTSASLRAYSQSPPSNMPPSRKQSLRRQINRRPKGKHSITNMLLQPPSSSNAHQLPSDKVDERREFSAPDAADFQRPPGHSRRSSAHSIRTSLVLPSISDASATAKNSAATTSTTTPQTTIPVAHFTLPRTKSSGPIPDFRPESSDSLASANLISTLQRSGTGQTSIASNDSSSNNSRWSGFMNFWSGRRTSSTDQSDYLQTTDDGIGFRGQERVPSQLEQMVQELSMDGIFGDGDMQERRTAEGAPADASPEIFPISGCSGLPASAARPIPERPRTFDSQLKLSVNEKDGVIDVDIPLPDFGSPLQSPLLGGYGSASSQHGSSFGESSVLSAPYCEPEQAVNAAGWLGQFHPDFAIQAIKPYKDVETDIRRAMSAEPTPISHVTTPSLESGPLERWVDVCTALLADTRNFSIKRIRLRRLVKLIAAPSHQPSAMTPAVSGMPAGRSQYGNPYTAGPAVPMMTEIHLAEDFSEETIMDFDATLIDGVDRALAQSGDTTRANSTHSSRASSRRGRHDLRAETDSPPQVEKAQLDCKTVIFDALETVVKDVTAARGSKEGLRSGAETKSDIPARPKTATDSSLKEGVRRWLVEVE
ncbi:folliculin-interacting protein N-terminus-domain-containing protein [Paraphoma chrysanthemicola]|uniref:Folliculin-interacting protein N-terminus-domain-containing protein n=1 Tax=Paraphoma chrysanthemicola TaxID=798071 RepID=A0A8K0R974_9PLEO|nr:folliculin-interacting protein N-terminus-domain-containing protein [Paraphoma chrysanthemicola]